MRYWVLRVQYTADNIRLLHTEFNDDGGNCFPRLVDTRRTSATSYKYVVPCMPIQLVKMNTLHTDSFSDHLHCSDYYNILYPLLCPTAKIDRTGSDMANEEATISYLFSVTSKTL